MLRHPSPSALLIPLLLIGASACGSSDDDSAGVIPFVVQGTAQSVAGSTPVRISGRYAAYLADEATTGAGGTTFNTDLDVIDSVAFVVDLISRSQTNTTVAAVEMEWLGSQLFLRVSEAADGVDWNTDTDMADQVLVHWTPGSAPVFVATLANGAGTMVKAGGRLFVALEDTMAPGMGMTNLGYLESAAPTTVVAVTTTAANAGGVRPVLLGEDEDLVFVSVDENADGDLNGDGDGIDAFVLGLIDATDASPTHHNVGFAVAGTGVPFRARRIATSDWLVGFLVNEAAQADLAPTGYNDRSLFAGAWEPPHCAAIDDTDTLDDVLFFLEFADFINPGVVAPPVNTGLVGGERVVAVSGFVGTISLETDDGGCDLNNDTDTGDRVFRWVAATTPVLPPTNPTNELLAMADLADIPGGTFGVAELSNRFVVLVSEANDNVDYTGDAATTFNVLGWFDPATSTSFTFDHGSGGPFFGGATWMAETEAQTQLLIGRPENVDGTNENVVFGADADTLDSLPTFLQFSGSRLTFPTARLATETGNSGIVSAAGQGLYRVSEAEESLDWNQDGDMNDFVLARSAFLNGFTAFVGMISDLPRPAMDVDLDSANPVGGVIVTDERLSNTDLNGDGDALDYVLRHFRL